MWTAALVASATVVLAAASTRRDPKKCIESYPSPVVNLCPEHWPDTGGEKVWLILFYAHWCGHCRTLEPKYVELARQLSHEKDIGVAAIDCHEEENRALCRKRDVTGYPTLEALVSRKYKSYEGARETSPMKDWIEAVLKNRGSKGGSSKCPRGLFTSKANDTVVPLCGFHFPGVGTASKHPWLTVFYASRAAASLREAMNGASQDLGNNPRGKALLRRTRLDGLAKTYELKVKLPKKGPFGTDALAKVGAVCCDCGETAAEAEESARFCGEALGTAVASQLRRRITSVAAWVGRGVGRLEVREGVGATAKEMVELALMELGFLRGKAGGGRRGGRGEEESAEL